MSNRKSQELFFPEHKDTVDVKGRKWVFDEQVSQCFDDMLSRSIPDYENMRELTKRVGRDFIHTVGAQIVDIGCSSGGSVLPFVNKFGGYARYYLYDASGPMVAQCRKRFKSFIDLGLMEVREYDIRQGMPIQGNALVISCLTLQFIPIEYRQAVMQSIYDSLLPGGAVLLIEKVLGNDADLDRLMVKEYYDIKRSNAYTEEQIQDKRKSLEGVLVPITAKWNEDLLRSCGFPKIDCYWRYLNFAAWVAVKR